jgi:hypothetical protein
MRHRRLVRSLAAVALTGSLLVTLSGPSPAAPGPAELSEAMPPPSGITTLDPVTITEDVSSIASQVPSAAAPPFGPNILASVNAASLLRPQTEPTVASKPSNRNVLIGGYMDFVEDAFPGVTRSADGGFSWSAPSGGATLPNPPGFTWGDRTSASRLAAGDPAIAWGLGDTVYYSTLGFQDFKNPPTPNTCDVGGLHVYRSDDGGQTWMLPAGGPAIPNTQTIFRDKEFIAVDSNPLSPHAGTVYMVWDDDQYLDCPQDFDTNFDVRRIMFSKSTDGGATWSDPLTLATGCLVTPVPAVGRDGAVHVVWYDCNSAGNPRQLVRTSTDGGVSFGAAVAAASGFTDCPNPLLGASFRVNAAFPAIATDPTDANRVYVVWSSCTVASQADVFLARSTNGGGTWSAPLRVNDDAASNPRDQFMPWLTVDDQGDVWVMWGDDRLDSVNAGGHFYDIFTARSTDNGASFGANVRVTSESSDPDIDFGGGFIGDYFGFASCGTPIWADTRNGNQDAFAAGLDADANGAADTCARAQGDELQLHIYFGPKDARTLAYNNAGTLATGDYDVNPVTGSPKAISGTGTMPSSVSGDATVTFNIAFNHATRKWSGTMIVNDPGAGFSATVPIHSGRFGVTRHGAKTHGVLWGFKAQSVPQRCFMFVFEIDDVG